ncbi:tyrosine-type recombinase/integrase [Schlesneria paludicola]|uniref:tyrosine-type recombinase/integrase n=1 Tax=Schlesneria paludicola TaxID=360056 RepID=UPI00029A1097|nr:site-specific integrase [Schlesneria paludicola]
MTINELVLLYVEHARSYYAKDGKPNDEFHCIASAVRPLLDLAGETAISDFGPLSLKAVRESMIQSNADQERKPWTRDYINKAVSRIRRVFKWGVSQELFGPAVLQRLQSLEPLLKGRTDAKDNPARSAVPLETIEAVRNEVKERIRDMMDIAVLTGARPGELVYLTVEMIDSSADVLRVVLPEHKMRYKGRRRVLYFGPKAQLIVKKHIKGKSKKDRLFPIRRGTFSNSIKRACDKLKIPRFTGHWLRHNAGTQFRKLGGLDAAQVMLGHSHADVTQIYADADDEQAIEIAREHG